MTYRVLPDLNPPAEADLDASAAVEAADALALAEQHRRMLTRMAEIGMELLEINAQNAKIDPAAGVAAGVVFSKISQAVRRTIALQAKLARDIKADHDGLSAERTRRRADAEKAHKEAKDLEIIDALHGAYAASCRDLEYEENEDPIDRLLEAQESFDDDDEFRGYLDRPVGETVARLCAVIGLDPDSCVLDGETWKVRRPATELELSREEVRKKGDFLPPPCGEGQIAQ